MHKIISYKKMFEATPATTLADLKVKYRNLIKEWHPDKFADDEVKKAEADLKSQKIIEAYHCLVGIHPETHAANMEEYTKITNSMFMDDFVHSGTTLKITFQEGIVYEYYGVPKNTYIKMVNSPTVGRFAKRHIFNSFPYRNISKSNV